MSLLREPEETQVGCALRGDNFEEKKDALSRLQVLLRR